MMRPAGLLGLVLLAACASAKPPPPKAKAKAEPASECGGALREACVDRALALAPAKDPRVVQEALRLLELACDADSARGCSALADAYGAGSHTENEPPGSLPASGGPSPEAVPVAQKACRLGSKDGCTMLSGWAYTFLRPTSGEADLPRAVTLYREACTGGEPEACFAMGRLSGEGGYEPLRDIDRSARYFATACEGGHADGCAVLATLTATGNGVAKNVPAARTLAQRTCEAGSAEGCGVSGVLAEGTAAQLAAFERGCEIGKSRSSAFSCAQAAYRSRADAKKSKELYEKACTAALQGKEAPEPRAGCVVLAMQFDAGGGFLVPQDDGLALGLYDHACAGGGANASRGSYYERRKQVAKAKQDYARSCKLGNREACEPTRR